ncbi:MAG: phosphopentomutase [Desulfuromonadales bacterium]|nr:phosphopentomutase [Desulfuromonadales bacterium]
MNRGRVVWIILDGVGLEALPDAKDYGDEGAATLPHVASVCGGLNLPNLQRLGIGNLVEIKGVPLLVNPCGAYGRLAERSAGKDSIVGHWELAGIVVEKPFAIFPQGFPDKLVAAFAEVAGVQPLGNVPAGGISILKEYGAEHVRTGRPILYTSVDSVFQVAAHEEVLPRERLYELCQAAKSLVAEYNIARVIARPFVGSEQQGFRRTPHRKDFTVPPPRTTLLEALIAQDYTVSAVGKISDLFAGRGISRSTTTFDNADGMSKTLTELNALDKGLLLVNLIDFDMAYGHRNDAVGFGRALEAFDTWLPRLYEQMQSDDILVISADHGCDPTTPGTDHTREYVPVLVWSKSMQEGAALGDRQSFADLGATLAAYFGVPLSAGESFLDALDLRGRFSF